ncbi:MAG: hypothetical protein EBY49_04970, partial [Actinobacteria bacterium]|nr:hypothetical protein [Actinomycetota bacterium]
MVGLPRPQHDLRREPVGHGGPRAPRQREGEGTGRGQHRWRDLVGAARRHARHRRTDRRRSTRRAQRRTHHRPRHLVINSLGETHRSFLGLNDVPQTVDLNPVAEVAREHIASISPEAAAAIPADTDWSIDLPTENIPNSSPVKTFLETSVPFLAGISLVMVLMAFLTTSDRPSVLRKAAFWAIGTTAVYLLLGYGVPALVRFVFPDQAEIFAALLTALLRTTLVPSTVLGVIGVGGMGACHARHVVDLAGAELAWVADPDEAVGRSLANELGCEWLAEGMDRIDEADALVIACPDRFHYRYVMAGLERGLPVLAEKPLTVEL